MGKQKKKDKLYISAKEWKYEWGGYKDRTGGRVAKLAFDCCSLSFSEFKTPVCTRAGTIYEITNIIPWIQKHGTNPVDGKRLRLKDLISLNFDKTATGKYRCPISFREFTEHSHIVAIRQTGNVFSMETIQDFCLKTKKLKDLLTDVDFKRSDIITIQDPLSTTNKDITQFHHVKKGTPRDMAVPSITQNSTMKSVMAELNPAEGNAKVANTFTGSRMPKEPKKKSTGPRSQFTSNQYSASFTSTSVTPHTSSEKAFLTEEQIVVARYAQLRKSHKKGGAQTKAYLRLTTTLGPLNLELHCDVAPKTVHNFILLCQRGYYDKTVFHRLIPGFMIQGGDPTGTGTGGQSAWKEDFKDEFHPHLTHDARGILSMANKGSHTNSSQFFITFAECKHLDNKHTIFGRVVGGLETLEAMEHQETGTGKKGGRDTPVRAITITGTTIYQNPFEEEFVPDYEASAQKEKEAEEKKKFEESAPIGQWFSAPQPGDIKAVGTGVGKYLDAKLQDDAAQKEEEKKKKKKKKKKRKKNDDLDDLHIPQAATTRPRVANQFNFSSW